MFAQRCPDESSGREDEEALSQHPGPALGGMLEPKYVALEGLGILGRVVVATLTGALTRLSTAYRPPPRRTAASSLLGAVTHEPRLARDRFVLLPTHARKCDANVVDVVPVKNRLHRASAFR
jgi:hypothetical protein